VGQLELPFWRAQTQVRLGSALAALGERQAAVERLVDAYRTARKLGAQPLAMQATEELASLGEPVERRLGQWVVVEHGGLSRRELEVLRLMALGKSNRDISDDLVITLRTVVHHVTSILNKTGAANRTEAAAYAARHGLVSWSR
jgi:DNA-binding NarL/FixJ family response regulator